MPHVSCFVSRFFVKTMRHKWLIVVLVLVLLIGGAFLFGMVVYLSMSGEGISSKWSVGEGIGVVTVEGPIVSADENVEEIEDFRKDDDIKAVVLRIESPGGSVAASQEILEAVSKLNEKKPVVASMGSVAASGGYYVACGSGKILANPGTITGSIGVKMEHIMVGDLLKLARVRHETLKSGRFKDMASVDRPMTKEERDIFQDMLKDIHLQFKEAVAKARGLDMQRVEEISDGRVYTGRQALALGLVDELGGFTEAVKQAAKMGNITGEPKLVYPKKRYRLIERIFESAGRAVFKSVSTFMDYWQVLAVIGN